MHDWLYGIGEWAVINENVRLGSPSDVGRLAYIKELLTDKYYNYRVCTYKNTEINVRESELNSIPKDKLDYYLKASKWKKVKPKHYNDECEIVKLDFLNEKAYLENTWGFKYVLTFKEIKEIKGDGELENKVVDNVSKAVNSNGYFESKGQSLGKLIDLKQEAYGDSVSKTSKLIRILLSDYLQKDGTYRITEELLDHILLQVRIIDKQNRIFSNPKADKMGESPYTDISGYGMLGERMQSQIN